MTDLSIFRIYEQHELGKDGYPLVWHGGLIPTEDLQSGEYIADFDTRIVWVVALEARRRGVDVEHVEHLAVGVKHVVRMLAGHRCVRCRHPFTVGKSGVMEGPIGADAKAFAAELGVNQEQLDYAFEDHAEVVIAEDALAMSPRTNWSPCDEDCTHGHARIQGKASVRRRDAGSGDTWSECDPRWIGTAGDCVRHGDEVEAAWRILTVHHLNGVKHDLRWWNLIPVCQRCHLYLQRVVVMERVYPFEHDDYFKPYAAGWYASTYLNEDLTREETMERMDELLALERMA